ncbi:hypothetical protein PVAP13_9NG358756 [Panicum virgatum]|uniref:Uncharacterized protein n=1 Tax=Panicum virgatum TaxID=38727 RepID=A0A8T0MRV2_PANVG|nr:hypothetical protein PVAP13_9NG358756 [Panicum virgatum]
MVGAGFKADRTGTLQTVLQDEDPVKSSAAAFSISYASEADRRAHAKCSACSGLPLPPTWRLARAPLAPPAIATKPRAAAGMASSPGAEAGGCRVEARGRSLPPPPSRRSRTPGSGGGGRPRRTEAGARSMAPPP